ncbi:MAG: hypothetical protein H6699_00060 [Myxococcales bacterium]|nr:hypothetical protein [Myxococcales bacterium]
MRSVDSEPVRVRFCELIAVGNSVTVKKILSIEDVPPDRLPPAEELSRRLGPNEGVLVGDTLYASGRAVDPFDRSAGRLGSTSEPTDPALADSELDRQFEELLGEAANTGPSTESSSSGLSGDAKELSIQDATVQVGRLMKLLFMLMDRFEHYSDRHLQRMIAFDERVEARSRELDERERRFAEFVREHTGKIVDEYVNPTQREPTPPRFDARKIATDLGLFLRTVADVAATVTETDEGSGSS